MTVRLAAQGHFRNQLVDRAEIQTDSRRGGRLIVYSHGIGAYVPRSIYLKCERFWWKNTPAFHSIMQHDVPEFIRKNFVGKRVDVMWQEFHTGDIIYTHYTVEGIVS